MDTIAVSFQRQQFHGDVAAYPHGDYLRDDRDLY